MRAQVSVSIPSKISPLICLCCLFLSACEVTESYDGVAVALDALASDPANFCTFTGNNMELMASDEFHDCSNEKIDGLTHKINEAVAHCESVYRGYYEVNRYHLLLKCEEEQGGEWHAAG